MKPSSLKTTPKQDGFRMPAEFEPHEKCWMLWPKRPDNWRLSALPAQKAFLATALAISAFEPVVIGVCHDQIEPARQILQSLQKSNAETGRPAEIKIVEMESDDAWMRDVGPTFVKNDTGDVRGVDWQFNAWGGLNGGLYAPWDKDEKIAQLVLACEQKLRYRAPLILEGGSIHTDGEGTLLTTEECLLNPNRNPDMSRTQIEAHLREYLNVKTIIWLNKGVHMDETDGHIDNLCCFLRPSEVLLTWTDDKSDPQYPISCDAFERLSRATDAKGRKLTIHKIHQPGPLFMTDEESQGILQAPGAAPRKKGIRLAGSYVNFYMANKGIVLPLFDDPKDTPAIAQLTALLPDRTVVGVRAREILLGGGNIHCITQQQPIP